MTHNSLKRRRKATGRHPEMKKTGRARKEKQEG
jgi:hypothetical protein